jgi:hypothetical protein
MAKKINNWSLRFLFQRTKFSLTRERNLGIYRTLTIISTSNGCQNDDSLKGPIMIGISPRLVKGQTKLFFACPDVAGG